MVEAGSESPNLQQMLKGEPPVSSKPVRLVQTPGEAFNYSGGGYLAVQQMIEDVIARSLPDLANELIFGKLGMASSTFDSSLPQAHLERAAIAHRMSGEPVRGDWHIYPEQAAASLWTTPSDLACLIIEVLISLKVESNRVLAAMMTRQMLVLQ